jgi:hypothetical protein
MKLRTFAAIGLFLAAATAAADTVVYDLDAKNAKEITQALQSVLEAQCQQVGAGANGIAFACHVELLPTGQLLVAAPDSAQAQVAAVLKAIAARNTAPTPRVTLQYWVISGTQGKPDAADAALRPLSSVLQQIEKLHGELGFAVEDSATLVSQSGAVALSRGGPLDVTQNVRVNGNTLAGGFRISFQRPPAISQNLSVDVDMKRGEYLVLGERTFREDEKSGLLFYIVHWPEGQ